MKVLVKEHAILLGMLVLISVAAQAQDAAVVASADKLKINSRSQNDSIAKPPMVRNASVAIDTLLYPFRFQSSGDWTDSRQFDVFNKTKRFYEQRGLTTRWLGVRCPNAWYFNLVDVLKHADVYGLNASDYKVSEIEERVASLYQKTPLLSREIVALDVELTKTLFNFTSHLSKGRITNPSYGRNVWIRYPIPLNDEDVILLAEDKSPDDLVSMIEDLQPKDVQYARLKNALARYRELEEASSSMLSVTTTSVKIKPQEKHALIPVIRQKLFLTDLVPYPLPADSVTGKSDSSFYDAFLVEGVKKFQARHGLTADGIIGERTLKFLDQSMKAKAAVITVNMERLRWMPRMEDDHYIEVNIPEYMLRAYDNKKEGMSMRVIVGSADKPTPVFTELLEHLIFSPTWTVPTSIIKEEIIPRLQRDSAYYSGKNYQFYRNNAEIDPSTENWKTEVNPYAYRIVQMPGSDNSLGKVKFVMPNSMNVYLHDTPNHRLFSKDYRALSHGCIRLSDPSAFAAYLLKDQRGWETNRINEAMNSGSPTVVHFKTLYKVYTSYRTAWVDDNGEVNFREDIYGYDQYQIRQITPPSKDKGYAEHSTVKNQPAENL
jgi:murein L,D-transpeptidase YcbB/YkuD